jgi:hypothetical protein
VILEESQRNNTSCLLEITVPWSRIHRPYQNFTPPAFALVLPSNIGPVPHIFGWKQEQPTKHATFPKGFCCYFDEITLQKQTSRRPKEERDYRSEKIFL